MFPLCWKAETDSCIEEMRRATRIALSLSLSIERFRDSETRQETKETSDGMPRKNIGSSRTNIICRLSNL